MSLLSSAQQQATRNGLNLLGLVDAQRFDSCQPRELRSSSLQPGCGTIMVLATAGKSLWLEFQRQGRHLPKTMSEETVDELAMAGATAIAGELLENGHQAKVMDARKPRMNFSQLAEAAGFGIVSPVSGLFLHPEYGPWVRVRAALLLPGTPFGAIADASVVERFQPCCTCQRPCIAVCPSAVHDGEGNSDRARCAGHRHQGGCLSGCHSRIACPIGVEHADAEGSMVHAHSMSHRTMQRWFGLGLWRIVPRRFRGAPR